MAVIPGAFRKRFRKASEDQDGRCCDFLCQTPIAVIAKAFGCEPFQLRSAADMFPGSRPESEFLNECYIMDVILNRAPLPAVTGDDKKGKTDYGKSTEVDYDVVCPFVSYKHKHFGPEMDYLYRAAILFLPQCGVFYCHRECCRGDIGMPGTLTAHDMSWLRLQRRKESSPHTNCEVSYTFGVDSFVRRFFSEHKGKHTNGGSQLGTGTVPFRIEWCAGCISAMMLMDPFWRRISLRVRTSGLSRRTAAAYQELLLVANRAKKDGRHYVDGCWYYELSESCWIVDPMETHFVDIVIQIDMSNVVGGWDP
jgi:hypothetical protein